jgi:hypothetical protein
MGSFELSLKNTESIPNYKQNFNGSDASETAVRPTRDWFRCAPAVADQRVKTEEPVVFRPSKSRWAREASASG